MEFQPIEFNHDQENIAYAMGLNESQKHTCEERIMFSSFSNFLQINELFDSREEAPKEMTTLTGDLARCLQMVKNAAEYQYTLLVFMTFQRQSMKIIALYDIMNTKGEITSDEKKKIGLLKMLLQTASEEDTSDDKSDPMNMLRRIDLVKKSHYNFDTYLNLVNSKIFGNKASDYDVDQLLNDLNLN